MPTYTGPLPHHRYIYVDTAFTHREPHGFVPAVWFALASWPSRAWGLTVVLESGACYRNLPPHAVAFSGKPEPDWPLHRAQRWDCYGWRWSANEYPYLRGQRVRVRCGKDVELSGDYMFSVAPLDDGFSAEPAQNKEFTFVALDNGRLTIQPTDYLLIADTSFCDVEWPRGLKRQTDIYSAEGAEGDDI